LNQRKQNKATTAALLSRKHYVVTSGDQRKLISPEDFFGKHFWLIWSLFSSAKLATAN
jgi:hypothetical protein